MTHQELKKSNERTNQIWASNLKVTGRGWECAIERSLYYLNKLGVALDTNILTRYMFHSCHNTMEACVLCVLCKGYRKVRTITNNIAKSLYDIVLTRLFTTKHCITDEASPLFHRTKMNISSSLDCHYSNHIV